MPINTKKPAMKQTVGAQYMCFANTTEGGEYDGTYEADVEKTEVVKSVKVTENSETSDVYAPEKSMIQIHRCPASTLRYL